MFFKSRTYNKFKTRKWTKLALEKRVAVFQNLEIIQAKKQKRNPCLVIPKDLEDVNGYHYGPTDEIHIHIKFIVNDDCRFLGMATLFHEGRHAFQYNAINDENLSVFSKAYRWKKNFEGYTSSDEDKYSFYSMQPVERDACLYAIKRLKRFRFRYRKESLFHECLKQKEAEFEFVKKQAKEELGIFYKQRVAFRNFRNRRKNKKD